MEWIITGVWFIAGTVFVGTVMCYVEIHSIASELRRFSDSMPFRGG